MVSISVGNARNAFAIHLVAITLVVAALRDIAAAADTNAIFRSVDRGRSWVRSDSGIPEGFRTNCFTSISDAIIAGTDSGVFVSFDNAQTWESATGWITSSGRVISLATLGRSVLAGTDGNGLFVTADRGKTWFRNDSFPAKKIRCLLVENGKLFAGTDALGVFVSGDKGIHWTNLTEGFPAQSQVFDLEVVDGKVFAGLYNNGLYAWNDESTPWEKAGNVLPLVLASSRSTLIAGHNPGGIYRSDDLGRTWSKGRHERPVLQGKLPSNAPVWELAANGKIAIAGASTVVYYSEDRGHTWVRARKGLPTRSPGIAFLLKEELILAAVTIGEYGRR